MATYTLSGTGTQGITSGTTRLFVEIDTYPPSYSIGRAQPANLFDVGMLRLGVGTNFYPAQPVDAGNMVIDVPSGVTNLGYNLFDSTVIRVGEGSPPPPTSISVISSLDGMSAVVGDSVTITFATSGTPDTHDFVALVDSLYAGPSTTFGTWTTGGGIYTSSGTNSPGTVAVASGSFTTNIQSPFTVSYPHTIWAFYGNDTTATTIAVDPAVITLTG